MRHPGGIDSPAAAHHKLACVPCPAAASRAATRTCLQAAGRHRQARPQGHDLRDDDRDEGLHVGLKGAGVGVHGHPDELADLQSWVAEGGLEGAGVGVHGHPDELDDLRRLWRRLTLAA